MYSFYDLMENGGTNNPGFKALPDYVQNQILANMAYGGSTPKKKYKESNFSGNAWYQEGGEEGAAQQEQIMQIIQMYAQLTEMEPEAVLEELQGMEEEDQQQALQSMVEQIQSAQGQQQGDTEEEGEVEEDDEEGEYMKRGGQPCYSCGGTMKYRTGGYIPEYGEMAYGGNEYAMMGKGGDMIRRKDGSYSKRGLWDNIRANKGSGKKPTKEMLKQEKKIRAKSMEYGGTNNPGFEALPEYVQNKILSNMAEGGEKMPPEIARARFAAAGNLDQMSNYGYAYGGMAYGGGAPQNYSAKQTKKFNFAMGGPAVGQEMEVTAKELESLRKQGYQFQII
jgi:hypothetical protein